MGLRVCLLTSFNKIRTRKKNNKVHRAAMKKLNASQTAVYAPQKTDLFLF
jgi:hypothetical protein